MFSGPESNLLGGLRCAEGRSKAVLQQVLVVIVGE